MLKTLFSFLCHYRILNPFFRFILSNKTDIPELNQIKRGIPIVVSLCCEEDNFDKLHYTLYSLFNQKVSPDKVVLWLSNRYELSELPYSITKFIKGGLDIRFVEDAGLYTKIIYALREFKDSIIVTADENIYYPKNWLLKLYHSYISNPDDIQAHSVFEVVCDKNRIYSVKDWKKFSHKETSGFKSFPVTADGVLYPPNCFIKDILREDIYKKKADAPWDIWSWVIAVVSGRKVRLVKSHIRTFSTACLINGYKKYSAINNPEQTDKILSHLLEYYGKNVYSNLNRD